MTQEPVGFLSHERGVALAARLPVESSQLVRRADEILSGRFQFFGYPQVVLKAGDLGDLDPHTGRRWPSRHGKRIDYRRGDIGDPKWVWELNRCQGLSVLAAAWLTTGDDRYGQAARERLLAWIHRHPPGRGIAWSNGFEAGVRAISFALTIDALRGSRFLDEGELFVALGSLWQHGRWIRRDPSLGSSANNHRVGELVGLLAVATLAPELRDSPIWFEEAIEELALEASRQIRSDGTGVEQAFSYHVFVVDLLLLASALLDARTTAVPGAIELALSRSGDALWAQIGENELAPTYGDSDDGRAYALDGHSTRDPRGVASAIAARIDHQRARLVAGPPDTCAYWLFGEAGLARFGETEAAPDPASVSLPNGGLTILRAQRTRVLFDHGPHGHTAIAAHAHADALHVAISSGADALIVDPGVGSYFAKPGIRDAFRGTSFHATITVDGRDSSKSGGPFLWSRHARAHLLHVDLARRVVLAEHDGYKCLADPVTHRRLVSVLAEGWIVVADRLLASRTHSYRQTWPFDPGLVVEAASLARTVAKRSWGGVLLSTVATAPAAVTVARGATDRYSGWWSAGLERVEPSWCVAVEVEATGVVDIATLVVPFDEYAPEVELRASIGENGCFDRLWCSLDEGRVTTVDVDLERYP